MNVLVTGATGQLGPYVVKRLLADGVTPTLWARQTHPSLLGLPVRTIDLTDVSQVTDAFTDAVPNVVLHCAAISSIDGCYRDPQTANAINVQATQTLARLCAEHNARLVYCSTDLVFDGEQGGYIESDAANPLSVYGCTKLEAEAPVLANARNAVIRFPMLFGPTLLGNPRFTDGMIRKLKAGEKVTLFDDEFRSAIAVDIAAEGMVLAAKSDEAGLFHLAGQDRLSRHQMGVIVAECLGLDAALIEAKSRLSMTGAEPRPADTSLCSDKWYESFPACRRESFEQSIDRLFGEG